MGGQSHTSFKLRGILWQKIQKQLQTGEEKESSSNALKAESKIQSFWHILTPDGKLHEIEKFNFAKYPNLEVLAKYEAAKKELLTNLRHM